MTKENIKIALHFLLLIPFQVLIANHMRLWGFINPQICLLFILWYPLEKNVLGILINSFLFGLCIDIFSNSGGINAASCLLIAYIRLPLLRIIFNDKELKLKTFRYSNYSTLQKIILIFCFAFIHQTVIYSLEYFSLSQVLTILYKSITNSLFTTFVIVILLSIFISKRKKQ